MRAGTASPSRPTWPPGPSRNWAASAACWSAARCLPTLPPAPSRPCPARPTRPTAPRTTPAPQAPAYSVGDKVATRKAYGDALAGLGTDRPEVVALDGEVSNSTHADEFAKAYPGRYFEMFIAEQQMVAAAVGLSARHYVPFASTFAAFFTPRVRLHPDGRHLAGQHPAVRIARRRGDRRGRAIPDGSGRPGHDARGARIDGAVPERRHQHGRARAGDGGPSRHQLPADHPRRLPGPVRQRGGLSRSAARRSCGRARTTP